MNEDGEEIRVDVEDEEDEELEDDDEEEDGEGDGGETPAATGPAVGARTITSRSMMMMVRLDGVLLTGHVCSFPSTNHAAA